MIFSQRLEIFKTAALCRAFEEECFEQIKKGNIKCPTYLSAGSEFIYSSLSYRLKEKQPLIFGQHRGHSLYLSFGGSVIELIDELLGKETGCARGMGGSASISSKEINLFMHDGLLGSNVPIAAGAAMVTKKPTLCIFGDGAAEECYALSALGSAATHSLPILFVCEDNNLSILTKKSVRRSWSIVDVAKGFGIQSYDISDDPAEILSFLDFCDFSKPLLLNINCIRKYWHCGAGIDDENQTDKFEEELKLLGADEIYKEQKQIVTDLWQKRLEM